MKPKSVLLVLSFVILWIVVLYNCSQQSNGSGISEIDKDLTSLLASYKYTGRVQEQLEVRLGRKLDPKKIELGRLIFFDKGLAWHQDNSCAGCHAPAAGFGDSQAIAIGIENNSIVGQHRVGPRNQRRSPMVINTGFFPSLMWNGRFASNSNDPFNTSKGFTFPAPEADTFFRANDANINHLLVAQAHIPFTELPEMAGFRNSPVKFNMSRFQGFLLNEGSSNVNNKSLSTKTLFGNKKALTIANKNTSPTDCEPYDVSIFSDDDTGFPLPPFENTYINFPIRRKIIELINKMPEYRRLFSEIYPQAKTKGIEFYMIGQAIAEFELFLTFAKAPIDKFAMGQYNALTEAQKKGAIIFFSKGKCVTCHNVSGNSNEMFSDFNNHNIGIPQLTPKFGIKTGNVGFATLDAVLCKNGVFDLGRFEFDGLESSKFLFRTSPLRNVSLQPNFFHNGAFNNLRDAVVYHLNPKDNIKTYQPYQNGVPADITYHKEVMPIILARLDNSLKNGIKLTTKEIDDLVDFLTVGLLDPRAKPEILSKLIPKKLPSGADLPMFESNGRDAVIFTLESADAGQSLFKAVDEVTSLRVEAYPNPFVDRTTVEYSLPAAGQVRYTLMDAKGRVIRQAQDGVEKPAGRHQIQLNGSDLPVGQYLYHLQAGSETRTIRLIKRE